MIELRESPLDGCMSTSSWSAADGSSFVKDTGCLVMTDGLWVAVRVVAAGRKTGDNFGGAAACLCAASRGDSVAAGAWRVTGVTCATGGPRNGVSTYSLVRRSFSGRGSCNVTDGGTSVALTEKVPNDGATVTGGRRRENVILDWSGARGAVVGAAAACCGLSGGGGTAWRGGSGAAALPIKGVLIIGGSGALGRCTRGIDLGGRGGAKGSLPFLRSMYLKLTTS